MVTPTRRLSIAAFVAVIIVLPALGVHALHTEVVPDGEGRSFDSAPRRWFDAAPLDEAGRCIISRTGLIPRNSSLLRSVRID